MYRFAIDNFRCNPDMIIVIVSRAIVIRTHGNNQENGQNQSAMKPFSII